MKRRLMPLALSALALLAACGQEDPRAYVKVDHNKDGKIIFEELIIAYPDLTVDEFRAVDKDRGGALSEEEFVVFAKARETGTKLIPPPAAKAEPAAKPAEAPRPEAVQAEKPVAIEATVVMEEPAAPPPGSPGAKPAAPPAPSAATAAPPAAPVDVAVPAKAEKPTKPEKPAKPEAAPAAAGETRHAVGKGETLSRIAKQYGVSVKDIIAANKIANPDRVDAGTELVIPAKTGD